jgi:hypothetical protein
MVCIQVFERSGGVKRETEPVSDSSLEGNSSSPHTIVKQPEDKSRTGRSESDGWRKTTRNGII